jgi:uncharacterized protein (TIGR02246 family)
MSHRKRAVGLVVALAALAAVIPLVARLRADKDKTGAKEAPGEGQASAPEDRKEDRAAIRKSLDDFIKAVEKGDAKAVAACWAPEGEYIGDDGTVLRGRAAIQKAYAEFFKANKSLKAEVTVESLRFVSKDTAIEEGLFKLTKGDETTTSRYSALHVREKDGWRLGVVRDWPEDTTSVRDLDWLVGTWASKRDGREVTTTYALDDAKTFLMGRYTIKEAGKTTTGAQVIGKGPETGELQWWTFEGQGAVGEGVWLRDGKKWVIESRGVLPDGTVMTARNVLTPIDRDSFTWQATGRTENDEELPDLPPVKVTRVKKSER